MVNVLFLSYLAAVLLAGFALWTIRFEFGGKAATRLEWAAPAAFAVLTAVVLLAVSLIVLVLLRDRIVGGGT